MENQSHSVVHVLYGGTVGGMQRAVYQLVKHLADVEVLETTVAFSVDKGPFISKIRSTGANVWIANLRNGWDITKIFRIYLFLRRFDVHHFHSASLIFIIASCLCGKKYRVYTNRGGIRSFFMLERLKETLMGLLLRNFFSAYSGNTSTACDAAAKRYHIPRKLFKTVYNGLDFNHIKSQRERGEVLKELDLAEEAQLVGVTAHLRAWKRIEKLIYLAKGLDRKTVVLIIGDGPDLIRLKKLAGRVAPPEKVRFLGMKPEPFDYVKAMDIFVLPSGPEESFGNSAVEAMVLGVPTIVYEDGGGLVEHIVTGETGYIVKDEQELYETVSNLLANKELARKIGEAGRNYIMEKYSVNNMVMGYYNLYRDVLGLPKMDMTGRISD